MRTLTDLIKSNLLIRHSFLYIIVSISSGFASFLLLFIQTKILTPKEFGNLAMAEAVLLFISPIVLLGLSSISIEYFKTSSDEYGKIVFNSWLLSFIASFFVGLLMWIFRNSLIEYFNIGIIWIFVLPLSVLASFLYQVTSVVYQNSKQPLKYAALVISYSLFTILATTFCLYRLNMGWASKIIAMFLLYILYSIVCLKFLNNSGNLISRFSLNSIRKISYFSIQVMPHNLAAAVYFIADRVFLKNLVDISSVGVYAVALQLSLGMSIVQDSLGRAWMPYVLSTLTSEDVKSNSKMEELNLLRLLVIRSYYGMLLLLLLSVLYYLCIKIIGFLFLSQKYAESIQLSLFFVIGYTLLGMYKIVVPYVWHLKKGKLLSSLTTAIMCINIGLCILLIPIYGTYGACYSMLISYSLQFTLTWYAVNRIYPMPWFKKVTL